MPMKRQLAVLKIQRGACCVCVHACVYGGVGGGGQYRKHRGQSGGRGGKEDMARVFIVASAGRKRQGLGLVSISSVGSGAQGLSLVVWYLAWGEQGRGIVAQRVKATFEMHAHWRVVYCLKELANPGSRCQSIRI